jgi:hypothetical protein
MPVSSRSITTPNHCNRSRFSPIASSFFWVFLPVNWLAICTTVHAPLSCLTQTGGFLPFDAPLLLRNRSRMAASCWLRRPFLLFDRGCNGFCLVADAWEGGFGWIELVRGLGIRGGASGYVRCVLRGHVRR